LIGKLLDAVSGADELRFGTARPILCSRVFFVEPLVIIAALLQLLLQRSDVGLSRLQLFLIGCAGLRQARPS
jgi:hypothetical protein